MKRQSLALPIARRPGRGWLVLIGGTSDQWRATEPLDRAVIELMQRDAPIAFVPAAACPPDYGESFLSAYQRLGASDGYVVPITGRASAHDAQNGDLLRNAGLIYFGGGETTALLESLTDTPALEAIAEAYEQGAVVTGMSAGAIALAERGLSLSAGVLQGWAWLPQLLVSVHHTPDRDRLFESALHDHPDMLGLTLPEDTALALGPNDEVEAWGDREITVKPRMSSERSDLSASGGGI